MRQKDFSNGTTTPGETTQSTQCPHCNSTSIEYKSKIAIWECKSCEERFPGPQPEEVFPSRRLIGDKAKHPKVIFFSYGHDDNTELVKKIKEDLENRGHTVWFDKKNIGTWDDWKGEITRGIDSSQMAVGFLSKHALRDPGVCRNEIAIALNRFGTVYPVKVEDKIDDDIPVTIRHLQWPDLSQWQAIRDGKVKGQDWERWYEAHLIELIEKIEGEASQFASESAVLREALRPSTFEAKFSQHLEGFVGREWVCDAYCHWLDKEPKSRLFWIKAGPGVGKSALAVNLAARQRGTIIANWFCDFKSNELRSPDQAIRTLAYQWAMHLEDYRVRLLRQLGVTANTPVDILDEVRKDLNKKNTHDLFRTLIVEPLANLIWREHKLVVVIDGLDEATDESGNNQLADFISQELASLPKWIGFVVTSRPEPAIIARLQGFKPFEIDAQGEHNLADLRVWYRQHIAKHEDLTSLSPDKQQRIEYLLLERSEGMMLYLKLVKEGLHENSLQATDLEHLQAGLPGLYTRYASSFQHRFGRDYETAIQPLTRLLVAADGPLPEDLACEVLAWSSEQFARARRRLGSYAVDTPEGIELFHKTLREFLIRKHNNDFYVDPALGRQQIANVLFNEVANKNNHEIRWREPIHHWLGQWWPSLEQKSEAKALTYWGYALTDWGSFFLAEKVFREALKLEQSDHPHDPLEIANIFGHLGRLLHIVGRYKEAKSYYENALKIQRTVNPVDHFGVATSLNNLASLSVEKGDYKEAEPLFLDSLAALNAGPIINPKAIASTLSNLAEMLKKMNRVPEAKMRYREALSLWESPSLIGEPDIAMTLTGLASVLLRTYSELPEAESCCRKALAIQRASLPTGHRSIAYTLFNLATILKALGQPAEALFREALAVQKKNLLSGHPFTATILNSLALLLTENGGHKQEAEQLYQEALTIQHDAHLDRHPDTAVILNNLASLLVMTDQHKRARELLHEALAILKSAFPAGDPKITTCLANLSALSKPSRLYARTGAKPRHTGKR